MEDRTVEKMVEAIRNIEPNLERFNLGVEIDPEKEEAWIFYSGIPNSSYSGSAKFLYKNISSDIRGLRRNHIRWEA